MKIQLYLLVTIFLSCSSTAKKNNTTEDFKSSNTESFCPDNGTCTFEVFNKKSLELNKSRLGKLYPKINDGNNIVCKFTYTKDRDERYQDSQYIEELYFELPFTDKDFTFENKNLSKTKLIFARLCFCRGQTGYYLINEGVISLKKLNNNSCQINITFKSSEVPQVITSIEETFTININ